MPIPNPQRKPVTSVRVAAITAGTAAATTAAAVALTVSLVDRPATAPGRSRVTTAAAAAQLTCATPAPRRTPARPQVKRVHGLTAEQRRKADELISTFENSTTEIRYDYAGNLRDGRGVTAGRAGFTTADGDALDVVRAYTGKVHHNPLARFVPALKRLADEGSDDTGPLPEKDYVTAWRKAAKDPRFRKVQDEVSDRLYFDPAMSVADRTGLRTALARAEVYDTIIQHGGGSDPDGLDALVKRANKEAGGTPAQGVDEKDWLGAFFRVRLADLRDPANKSTKEEWSESVDRVKSLQRIAASGGYDLHGTLHTTAYGDEFTIK